MDELTIKEIAENLDITPGAAKIRLQRQGISPVRIVGQTGIYAPSVVEQIRNVPGKGRPKNPRGDKKDDKSVE